MSNHFWTYCPICNTPTVICGTCGNNACNGGSGKLSDGSGDCPNCDSAYAMMMNRTGYDEYLAGKADKISDTDVRNLEQVLAHWNRHNTDFFTGECKSDILLIQKLKKECFGSWMVAKILSIIESTCPKCWDSEIHKCDCFKEDGE